MAGKSRSGGHLFTGTWFDRSAFSAGQLAIALLRDRHNRFCVRPSTLLSNLFRASLLVAYRHVSECSAPLRGFIATVAETSRFRCL